MSVCSFTSHSLLNIFNPRNIRICKDNHYTITKDHDGLTLSLKSLSISMVHGPRNKGPIWCQHWDTQAGMMGMYSSGYNCHHDVSYHIVDTLDCLVAEWELCNHRLSQTRVLPAWLCLTQAGQWWTKTWFYEHCVHLVATCAAVHDCTWTVHVQTYYLQFT